MLVYFQINFLEINFLEDSFLLFLIHACIYIVKIIYWSSLTMKIPPTSNEWLTCVTNSLLKLAWGREFNLYCQHKKKTMKILDNINIYERKQKLEIMGWVRGMIDKYQIYRGHFDSFFPIVNLWWVQYTTMQKWTNIGERQKMGCSDQYQGTGSHS